MVRVQLFFVFLAVCLCAPLGACNDGPAVPAPALAPSVHSWQLTRQNEFLQAACAQKLDPGNLNSVLVHLECDQRGLDTDLAANAVPVDAWDGLFEKLFRLRDTSDFDMTRIMHLLYDYRNHRAVPAELWAKTEQAVRDFKYWYTDPTPARKFNGEPVVDKMWYWTENHIMIFHVCEYLAGQLFPDQTFSVTGLKGREHMARARPLILEWLAERSRWGFTEWHSDVYYNWDMQPLLALIEYSADRELAQLATMVLDLVMLDVALHLHKGNMGSTHGRSYIKDKPAAVLQNIYDGAKLLFDDSREPYSSFSGTNGVAFARAHNYALPWVIREIARDDSPLEDRQRMNLPIDEEPPTDPEAPLPSPPMGLDWEDEHNLPFWWSMNAMTTWPLLAKTYEIADRYDLWDAQFEPLGVIRTLLGPYEGPDVFRRTVFPFYNDFWRLITEPLLEEVNTYTYRTADYMLSAAQSYRPGNRSNQTHIWQATLDEHAVVFATHPGKRPPAGTEQIDWQDFDEPGPGYWSGHGALPRVGAWQNIAIAIHAPQYEPRPLGLDAFDYLDETHAYFPVAHFEEVITAGNWTVGHADTGFVGLYSWRPVTWRSDTPEVFANGDQPFDLVATGGADNVWIVELAAASDWSDLQEFADKLTAATIAVTANAPPELAYPLGATVAYHSPSAGWIKFDWTGPLTVNSEPVALTDYKRIDNKYATVDFDDTRYEITTGGHHLILDFDQQLRDASPPPEAE